MSKRTVVAIEPSLEDKVVFRLSKAPIVINGAREPRIFSCDPDQMGSWSEAGAVQKHGQKIYHELISHNPVRTALDTALGAPPGEVHVIQFYLDVADADRLCWEALCTDKGHFLALDRRWPIVRTVQPVVDRPTPLHKFDMPLRFLVIISAARIPAAPEWDALRQAVKEARNKGLDIEMQVVVGEEELFQTIEADIQNGLRGVQVMPVPDRTSKLEDLLKDFRPHLVHFFCHGNTGSGAAWLELATFLDWQRDNPNGSVQLETTQLLNMLTLDDLWLVTLNCCKSGHTERDVYSVARELVANGVPAAVGMLEPVEVGDAHEFSAAFYPAVFDLLHRTISILNSAAGDQLTEVEWAETLVTVRKDLAERHNNDPSNRREWVLPVLYVQATPFQVDLRLQREQRRLAEWVARALQALGPDTSETATAREQLLALLADIPESLRPDRLGQFQTGGGAV